MTTPRSGEPISWNSCTRSRKRTGGRSPGMSEPEDIIAALRDCTDILITVHKSPDGDALGSQLGLLLALEKHGKRAFAHNLDPVPEIYRFLPHAGRITTGPVVPGTYDAI